MTTAIGGVRGRTEPVRSDARAHTRARARSNGRYLYSGGRRSAWSRRDALVLGLLGVVGGAGLAVCWFGASGEPNWHHQLSWVAGAALFTSVGGLGVGHWLLQGRRAILIASADLRRVLRADAISASVPAPSVDPVADPVPGYVASAAMTRFHTPACQLVGGKPDITPVTSADIAARGLAPCGVCGE